jgi:glutamine synthetase
VTEATARGRTSSDGEAAKRRAEELASNGVLGVALTYVDNSGITRVKAVPTGRLVRAVESGVGMSPVFDVFLLDDSITTSETSTGPVGDLRLYPDVARVVELSAQPGWAWAPVDRRTRAGEPHALCHRSFAARMVERAADEGLTASMAFELEWALGRDGGTDDFEPVATGPAYGMTRVVECSEYLRDVLAAFAAEGIEVDQVHPEYAASQFEISVAPNDPVGAADDSVLARQTLRAVGRSYGWRTSFAPSVVAGHVGNGGHVHMSLWRDGANAFHGGDGPYGMTKEAQAFAAGILRELPALLVIGAPSVASYLRLVPQHWAGAYQVWGHENREAALRLVTGTSGFEPASANLEVKSFDLSASPYLVAGSMLAAGLAGIAEGLSLPEEMPVDPATLPEEDLVSAGVTQLPGSLPEALEHYEASEVLKEALGHSLFETIAAVRRAECALFDGVPDDEVAARTRWRH